MRIQHMRIQHMQLRTYRLYLLTLRRILRFRCHASGLTLRTGWLQHLLASKRIIHHSAVRQCYIVRIEKMFECVKEIL